MQTFLPYPDFRKSAQVLDYRRLGKQRVEAWQIYRALTKRSRGWRNHPAVLMWTGHEAALLRYGKAVCAEWKKRGFRDSLYEKFSRELRKRSRSALYPQWFGSQKFHRAHRSNLLRKDPAYYRTFWPKLRDDLPYDWPVRSAK